MIYNFANCYPEEHEDITAWYYSLWLDRKKMYIIFKELLLRQLKIYIVLISYCMFLNLRRKTVKSTTAIRKYKQSRRK